jgi:hypothetical protein
VVVPFVSVVYVLTANDFPWPTVRPARVWAACGERGSRAPGRSPNRKHHGARPQVLGKTIVPVRPNNLERRDPRHHAGAGESATDAALVAWRSRIPSVAGRGSPPGGRGRRALSIGNREANSPKDVSLSPYAATVRDAG